MDSMTPTIGTITALGMDCIIFAVAVTGAASFAFITADALGTGIPDAHTHENVGSLLVNAICDGFAWL